MKRPMVLEPSAKVMLFFILVQLAQKLCEFFDVLIGHALHGDGSRNAFVGNSRYVERFQFARIKTQYPAAIIGLGLDQAFFHQHPQRFAHGCAADLKATCDLDLRQNCFRWQSVR
jgi:hypothetical protein